MSAPKRHHFVPQFYLKRFSAGKRFIRCFHKGSQRVIPTASIKGQCAIDNFYGWDERIEKALGVMEARAAQLLRDISVRKRLPAHGSLEWEELLIFIALQSSRTQLTGEESDDMADYYFKIMHKHEAEARGIELDDFKIGSKFPAALPMRVAMETYPELKALGACLLENKSRMPLLASDNPVLFYNSRFSNVDYQGTIGLTSQGLQIFYPISPSLVVMLFDLEAYRQPSNTGYKVLRERDAIQLNLLTYLWSGNVVYWSNEGLDDAVRAIAQHCGPYVSYERTVNRESERIELDGDQTGALLHSWRAHVPIEVDFSFIRANPNLRPSHNLVRGFSDRVPETGERTYVFAANASPRAQMRSMDLNRAISSITRILD